MKKVTKLLTLCLAMLMLILMYACQQASNNPPDSSPADAPDSTAPTAAPDNTTPADSGTEPENNFAGQTLVMATNAAFPPYEFYDGADIVGIDAEIAAAIADKLGMTLRIDDMEFNSIIVAVTSGKADMGMAGMTVTEERLQSVDFSTSYATGVQVVIVPEDSSITSVDDLFAEGAFHRIGVQEATTGDLYTTWDLEDEGLAEISRYNKGTDAVAAFISGKVDCVVIDSEPAKAFVAANPGLSILEMEYAVENYAIAFAKGNDALVSAVDNALVELINDGTVQAIIDKYIG